MSAVRSEKIFPVFSGFCKIYENHPWKRIFVGRDEIRGEESSLGEIFYRRGWNERGRIILGKDFLLAGMKWAGKNHLWKRILIGRDEMSGEESSLKEDFCWQGWNEQGRIILERGFLLAGMKWAGKNHPWKRFFVGGVVLCVPITVLIASLLLRAPLKNNPAQ